MSEILSVYMRSFYSSRQYVSSRKTLPKFSILIGISLYEKLYLCNSKLYEVYKGFGYMQIFRIELLA